MNAERRSELEPYPRLMAQSPPSHVADTSVHDSTGPVGSSIWKRSELEVAPEGPRRNDQFADSCSDSCTSRSSRSRPTTAPSSAPGSTTTCSTKRRPPLHQTPHTTTQRQSGALPPHRRRRVLPAPRRRRDRRRQGLQQQAPRVGGLLQLPPTPRRPRRPNPLRTTTTESQDPDVTSRRSCTGWSWRESNPRPSSGCRLRYDRSRACDATAVAPPGRESTRRCSPPGLSPRSAVFHAVSGLSLLSTTASVAGLRWSGPVRCCQSLLLSDA